MAINRILVVDDDIETRQMLIQFLRNHGFIALDCFNEAQINAHLKSGRIDLILLDVMLGDESGVEICANLRQTQNVPIILLSALSADNHKVAGYEVGADDYIAKPFNPRLLLARIKAVLQRTSRTSSLVYRRNTKKYEFSGWTYNAKREIVTAPTGYEVPLSKRETAILRIFLANPHIPLSREEIAATLDDNATSDKTGPDSAGLDSSGRAIDVLVGRLRGKIEADPKDPKMLRTERGVGYVFAVDVSSEDII